MPSAERRSAAEANSAPADQDAPPNERMAADAPQLLPIKRVDVIGIESNKPAYPQIVPALTRPPGLKLSADPRDPLENAVLPNLAVADVAASPAVQTATAAIDLLPRQPEEMAQLLGESDPRTGPAITDALIHPPDQTDREGGAAPLPELALADRPSAADVLDAITALTIEEPRPEEMAQKLDQAMDAPVIAGNNGAAGTARSSSPQLLAATGGVGGIPGPPMPAADPAPDTGLESDPFAKIPGVEFHDGQVEARSGRQIKPIRPRLSEAGKRDLLAHEFPTILLKVRIDKTGKVTDVKIVRGSGSEAVDMPVYRALWQWWFEPPKDKQGNPLEDVQLVAIHWG
jgi:TonB family protein